MPYRREHIYDQLLSRIREEFVEHLQIGKQIGKLLDMPKRPRAQKHICWDTAWFKMLLGLGGSQGGGEGGGKG